MRMRNEKIKYLRNNERFYEEEQRDKEGKRNVVMAKRGRIIKK